MLINFFYYIKQILTVPRYSLLNRKSAGSAMKDEYFQSVQSLERLHRLFLDVVKTELDNMKAFDINNVQAIIVYNIGTSVWIGFSICTLSSLITVLLNCSFAKEECV